MYDLIREFEHMHEMHELSFFPTLEYLMLLKWGGGPLVVYCLSVNLSNLGRGIAVSDQISMICQHIMC
jgi:hypothetical protein